jgi:hypothetical protein
MEGVHRGARGGILLLAAGGELEYYHFPRGVDA